jgi:hypothetical protein
MLNKYGYESYQSTKEYRDIIYEKYGVSNISKLQDVKNKKIESAIKKYGVDNVAKSKEVIDKMKSTMILRYGFDNPTKNREIFEKAQSSAYKTYKFEDTNLKYQGSYELDFIKFTRSRNIKIENGPSIRYEMNLVNRIYHSDFYLPDFNLICEIKSTYTFNCDYDENLMKQKFAIKSGYNFLFIIDKNYSDLEKIINENATE